MREKWKHLNYQYKVFICLLISTAIPLIILGAYSYKTYTLGITKEVNLSVESSLKQLKLRMDTTVNNVRKYYIEASENENIKWLMNNDIDYTNYSKLVKSQDVLSCSAYLSEYINGYTIINWDTGWVLSNRGMYKYEAVTNQEAVEKLKGHSSNWVNNMALLIKQAIRREEVNLKGLLYYQNLPLNRENKNALLVVNVDLEKVNSTTMAENGNTEITIIDGDGKVVYATDLQLANFLTANFEQVKSGKIKKVEFSDKTAFRIGSMPSDIVNWTYIIGWNSNIAREGAKDIILMTGIIFVGVTFILFIIILLTRVIYKPVMNLRNYANGVVKSKKDVNDNTGHQKQIEKDDDFKCISGRIDYLVDNNNILEKLLDAQKAQLSEFFQNRLISGNLNPEQIDMYLSKLGLHTPKYYVVMTIGLQNLMNEEYNEAKQDALRLEVMENIPKEIKEMIFMEPSCNARVISVVVSAEFEKELDKRVIEIYKGLDIYVQLNYKFPIKIGVSSIYTDMRLFRNAHNEGIEALKNNELLHKKSQSVDFEGVMFYSDIVSADEVRAYDRFIEKEVREAVDAGEKEKAFAVVDSFMNHLVEQNVAKVEREFYLHHFMNEIVMVAIDAGLAIDQIFGEDSNSIFQSINHIYDLNKLANFYKYKLIVPVIDGLNQFRTSKSSQIIKEIISVVEETKGDVTLTECAERLNYHTTYIWKVMKIEKNTTFSDYVAKYKVEAAKKLLLETSLTVNEIATQLNYTNSQNFIRFFSRIEGVTPGKFRTIKGN